MQAAAAVTQHEDWREALADALAKIASLRARNATIDLALLFASHAYAPEFPELVARTCQATGARVLVGCSGQGVIGPGPPRPKAVETGTMVDWPASGDRPGVLPS